MDNEFRQHFRLARKAFEFIINKVREQWKEHLFEIPLEKPLLAVIWLLANQETYRYLFQPSIWILSY